MKKAILAIVLVLAFVRGGDAVGGGSGDRSNLPIQVKSNELSTDATSGTATFSGKVSARQGDITIYSDQLIVHYSAGTKGVEKVEAMGNVRIVQGDRLGEAARAVYDNKKGQITLEGNPKVYQGDDVVSGRVITYFLDEQKSEVTGGADGRVEAVIHPRDKGKDAGAKP